MAKFIFTFGLILISLNAFAYIPPGWFVLKSVAQKKHGFKWVRIRSNIQELNSNGPQGDKLKVVTLMDYEKGLLKTTVSLENGSVLETKEERLSHSKSGLGALLLFESRSEGMVLELKELGLDIPSEAKIKPEVKPEAALANLTKPDAEASPAVDLEKAFMTRVSDRIVWGYGNRELPPQLFIEKDKFLPVKFTGKLMNEAAEISFGNYQFTREFPYPTQTEVRIGSDRFKETFEDAMVLSSAEKDKKKDTEPMKATPSSDQAKLIRKYFDVLR